MSAVVQMAYKTQQSTFDKLSNLYIYLLLVFP